MEKKKITQKGKDLLIKQLEELEEERKETLDRLEIARQFGDLKENSEYLEAKGSLVKIDQEMDEIKSILSNAIVVQDNINHNIVEFGVTVTIQNLENGDNHIYKIVGDAESDISEGLLSENSPIAKCMIGKSKDAEFEFKNDRGSKHFKILKIE